MEGVAVDKHSEGEKTLIVGKRMAAEKVKEQQHDSKESQAEAFAKLEGGMTVNSVTQASHPLTCLMSCQKRSIRIKLIMLSLLFSHCRIDIGLIYVYI